jgi:hypothetical protein
VALTLTATDCQMLPRIEGIDDKSCQPRSGGPSALLSSPPIHCHRVPPSAKSGCWTSVPETLGALPMGFNEGFGKRPFSLTKTDKSCQPRLAHVGTVCQKMHGCLECRMTRKPSTMTRVMSVAWPSALRCWPPIYCHRVPPSAKSGHWTGVPETRGALLTRFNDGFGKRPFSLTKTDKSCQPRLSHVGTVCQKMPGVAGVKKTTIPLAITRVMSIVWRSALRSSPPIYCHRVPPSAKLRHRTEPRRRAGSLPRGSTKTLTNPANLNSRPRDELGTAEASPSQKAQTAGD